METNISDLYQLYLEHPAVSTDTRRIAGGSIFFALRGASFDGNLFAEEALKKGAAVAVVDRPEIAALDSRMFLVDDTLEALQALARHHRRALRIPILAVAGSNGKTTTKELVSRVLAQKFEVYATRGNLNNHIGVPLTLLSMTRATELGVVEMGASACGEIALLASIAEPDYGVLTNIGRCHLEGFGGPEGVRRGKGELFDFLAAHSGEAFVRAEDATLTQMAAERKSLKAEYYPTSLADGIDSHLEGDYNRYNIAAAVAIGRHFGVADELIHRAISEYHPDNNRSQLMLTAHNTLVVDCYNANPSSMKASIDNFMQRPIEDRDLKVLILGDMRELGEWSEEEHVRVIRHAAETAHARLILVGSEFAKACARMTDAPDNITLYPSREELTAALTRTPLKNAMILIKGSNGIGLQHIIEYL